MAAETVLLLLSALLALRASVNRVKIKTKALSIWAGGKKTPIDTAGQRRMDPRAAHANSFVGIQHSRWALTAAQRPTDSPRPRPPLATGPLPHPRAHDRGGGFVLGKMMGCNRMGLSSRPVSIAFTAWVHGSNPF